jgi:hypothetical protein
MNINTVVNFIIMPISLVLSSVCDSAVRNNPYTIDKFMIIFPLSDYYDHDTLLYVHYITLLKFIISFIQRGPYNETKSGNRKKETATNT